MKGFCLGNGQTREGIVCSWIVGSIRGSEETQVSWAIKETTRQLYLPDLHDSVNKVELVHLTGLPGKVASLKVQLSSCLLYSQRT